MKCASFILMLLATCCAQAADRPFTFELLRFQIPEVFGKPQTSPPTLRESKIPDVVFVAVSPAGPPHDVLQFRGAVVSVLGPREDPNEDHTLELESMFMDSMMDDMKAIRTAFVRTPTTRLRLGGKIALRARWTGIREGHQMNGVMYTLIVGSMTIHVSMMGPGGRPDANLQLAIDAVERATLWPN